MDSRLILLKQWLEKDIGIHPFDIVPASEDASFRRYFRIHHNNETHIVMDAPPDKEDCRPYIAIARAMASIGLNVPRIIEANLEKGLLLISDLGSNQYLNSLDETNVDRLYQDALDALLLMQRHGIQDLDFLPRYDQTLLSAELELFRHWYIEKHLGRQLSPAQHTILDEAFRFLIDSALEQPVVWVHRDYHSRNLMVTKENNPGILDFQDAVHGPVTYDLVSLLRDCYIQWPDDQVKTWVTNYHQHLIQDKVIENVSERQFLRWFDLMGVQRHFKASGIFARLNIRDNKPGYLQDIPRTLNYVIKVSKRYPELDNLHGLLSGLIHA